MICGVMRLRGIQASVSQHRSDIVDFAMSRKSFRESPVSCAQPSVGYTTKHFLWPALSNLMPERNFQDVRRDLDDVFSLLRNQHLDPNKRAMLLGTLSELFIEADRLAPVM